MASSTFNGRQLILIVESEALIRMELVAQLQDMNLDTLSVSNADEAIKHLELHPEIEILLTDIEMLGSMDGIRLAHYVRDRWPPVKIVITSGAIENQLRDLPTGSTFFPKPYGPETLIAALSPFLYLGSAGASA